MPLRSLLFVCAVITLLIYLFRDSLFKWGFDIIVLYVGNILLLLVSVISLYFHIKGAGNKNSHAFVRGVYMATMLKMFVVALAVIAYAIMVKPFNKFSVVLCMLFYIIYTFIEIKAAIKITKAS
ncbi:MAG TPA: hypothetical protein VFN30_12405 [Chitinophagaceae bacterium]|nr:hypothetical protein [Chitinophagaceae bacterium]